MIIGTFIRIPLDPWCRSTLDPAFNWAAPPIINVIAIIAENVKITFFVVFMMMCIVLSLNLGFGLIRSLYFLFKTN